MCRVELGRIPILLACIKTLGKLVQIRSGNMSCQSEIDPFRYVIATEAVITFIIDEAVCTHPEPNI